MRRSFPLTLFVFCCALAALADEPPVEKSRPALEAGVQLAVAPKRFDRAPFGLDRESTDPAQSLLFGVAWPMGPGPLPVELIARGNLSFVRPFGSPIVGAEGGVALSPIGFRFEALLVAQLQSLLGSRFEGSPFDDDWIGIKALASIPLPWITPKLGALAIATADGNAGSFEGIDTEIKRKPTLIASPAILFTLPFGIQLEGGVDAAFLGSVAVVSKEFAFAIPGRTVLRYHAGLGWKIFRLEAWARVASLDKIEDLEEHFYQAPFFHGAYFLAPQTASLELKWKF